MSAKMRIVLQSVISVMLCIVLIMLMGYTKMRDVLLENRIQFYTESMKLQKQNIEYFKKLIENVTDYSVNENSIKSSLSNSIYDSSIATSLTELRRINPNIIGYTVYSFSGIRYESNSDYNFPPFDAFAKSKEYQAFLKSGKYDMWIFCTEDIPKYTYSVTNRPNVVSYIRKIYDGSSSVGIVVANIATSSFMKYFSYDSFGSDFSLSIYIPGNTLIYGSGDKKLKVPDSSEIADLISSGRSYMLSKGKDQLIIAENLLGQDTYIVKTISLNNFYTDTNRLKALFIAIAVILLLLLVFFYTRLAENIFSPLIALHDKMIEYRGQS